MTDARKADVVIPVYADVGVTKACIEAVLAASEDALGQLIIVNDCSPEPETAPMIRKLALAHPAMVVLTNEENLGFVRSCNRGIFCRQRDVVLLNSDTIVTPGWLRELLEVAYTDDRVACVAPLSNNASISSVPRFGEAMSADEVPLEEIALASSFVPRATEAPTAVGFCILMRDVVIKMIGGLDPKFGRGYNEENDWVMRAQRLGFRALRANRAFVYHLGEVSFGGARKELDRKNERLLHGRHPHYEQLVRSFCEGPEARVAAHYMQRRLGRLSVRLDLRHLTANVANGSSVYGIELAKNLSAHTQFHVSACIRAPEQKQMLDALGIPAAFEHEPLDGVQVLHRPAQIFDPRDVAYFLNASAHCVITYLDLIAYRAPSCFLCFEHFSRYRAQSFALVHAAQAVIAISEHNRQEIIRELHVPPDRVVTVHLGVDAECLAQRDVRRNIRLLAAQKLNGPFFLYAGTDYAHKNIRLLIAAYEGFRSAWREPTSPPALVLVGPLSGARTGAYDTIRREPAEGVRYLGIVSHETLRALFQETTAFVFLSAYEGFGLPVLEAMAAGAPVVCSSLTSLPEVAGDCVLYVRDFSAEEVARLLLQVATNEALRARLIAKGRERAKLFSWAQAARRTADVYLGVIDGPAPTSLYARRMFSNLLTGAPRL